MTLVRLAAHLGFPTPDAPLFAEAAGTIDPIDQIAFAADQGFCGVLDPFVALRSTDLQDRIGAAAAARGLAMGAFLYLGFDRIARARWGCPGADERATLLADVAEAISIARRIGSRDIAVLSLAEPGLPDEDQAAVMTDNLRFAGDLAAAANVRLCVEGVNRQRLPQMMLHGALPTLGVVKAAAHPAVRLLFDTGHVAAAGEDLVTALDACGEWIGAVQIADHPGRLEMGAGSINFAAFFEALRSTGYGGLCELEHGWSATGVAVQRSYLARLRDARWLSTAKTF